MGNGKLKNIYIIFFYRKGKLLIEALPIVTYFGSWYLKTKEVWCALKVKTKKVLKSERRGETKGEGKVRKRKGKKKNSGYLA